MAARSVNFINYCLSRQNKVVASNSATSLTRNVSTHILKQSLLILFHLFVLATSLSGQTSFYSVLSDSAFSLTMNVVEYDPSYFKIAYPNGDVPANKGVCTDVVIRAYRKLGIDLQKLIHVDMIKNFEKYPKIWGLSKPDSNIDHRRVPNLMTYFKRFGMVKPISSESKNYAPGDIVCWNLYGGVTHIGIVSSKKSEDGKRNLIIHNIGRGQVLEDCLFSFKIIGHYSYKG